MSLFDFEALAAVQISLVIIGGFWFLRRNDEIPLVICALLAFVSSYRYWIVVSGSSRWVSAGQLGLSQITQAEALEALGLIVLGQCVLIGSYCVFQPFILRQSPFSPNAVRYVRDLAPKILVGAFILLPLVLLSQGKVSSLFAGGARLAYGFGYVQLFPLALVGVSTLVVWLWRFGGLPSTGKKILALIVLYSVFQLTFSASGRFQFIGWIMASSLIWPYHQIPRHRLVLLLSSTALVVMLFAGAGALRQQGFESATAWRGAAFERTLAAEDANMLDGFVLLRKVYPSRLSYRYGMEHLEILFRPIPRSWWPDKPTGGFVNRLGLYKGAQGATLGISPSIFGSFFAEGGIYGVIFLSTVYGFLLSSVVRYSMTLEVQAGVLLRASMLTSLIPLLRGGDIPGVYAWIGMSFWPCALVLWSGLIRFQLRRMLRRRPEFPNP